MTIKSKIRLQHQRNDYILLG